MKFTSAIFLLTALLLVAQIHATCTGCGEPSKRSISTKRTACYYNNTFTLECESVQEYQARNSEADPGPGDEWLDTLYHELHSNSIPHRDDEVIALITNQTYATGMCPSNNQYNMKLFVLAGHLYLGFWPVQTSCPAWILDSRTISSHRNTFGFLREAYHDSSHHGLKNITDTFQIATVNIESVRAHMKSQYDANTFYSGTAYDIIENNCGRVIVGAILATGNFVSLPLKEFIVERVMQYSGINVMYANEINMWSLWPTLTASQATALGNTTRAKKAYVYQQNKHQVNHPSCDYTIVSSVNRDCRDSTPDGPVYTGSNPEVYGPGYTTNGSFCEFSYTDTSFSGPCGSFTRMFKSINLAGTEIKKNQTVVVDCPYCVITPVSGVVYQCTENKSVVRSGEAASGSSDCNGALSKSDSTLSTVCGTFTRTWTGQDYCGRTATNSNQQVSVIDSTPPTLTCPGTQVTCPTPAVTDNCGTPSISIQSSFAFTRYTVTNRCGEPVTFDCENTCVGDN